MKYLAHMKVNDHMEWLNLALTCKKQNVAALKVLELNLSSDYAHYDHRVSMPTISYPPSVFLGHGNLLRDYYENPPASVSKLIQSRRNDHMLGECPYCGYPSAPDTLDHFVPKDDWPELSFYANNLVPQCRGCAPTKSKRYYGVVEKSVLFVHPIYYDLLSKIGFKVEVSFDDGKPSFSVGFLRLAPLTDDEVLRLGYHFSALHIKERFHDYCVRSFMKWLRKVQKKKFNVRAAFELRLAEVPEHAPVSRNWKIAFLRGMLANDAAMNFLSQKAGEDHVPATFLPEELAL